MGKKEPATFWGCWFGFVQKKVVESGRKIQLLL